MKIRVDTTICSGQARCNAAAPAVFQLNDEGYNDSDDFEVSADQVLDACRGALACPEQAIALLDDDGVELDEVALRQLAGLER